MTESQDRQRIVVVDQATDDYYILKDAWPSAINFGDLDFSSSDVTTIEMTLRFSRISHGGLDG